MKSLKIEPTKTTDELWMSRCIELAKQGRYGAPPNPMVGAVIVHQGRILGEGYHARCGEGHAEVNAMQAVRPEDRSLLPKSTIYVSLEPCAHQGRTPACAAMLVRERVGRVVVGCVDSFAKVAGRGIAMLREAGIEVTVGVLEDECRALNRAFFTFHQLRRPFITLKWACSSDGFIDRERTANEPPTQFSSPETLLRVHRLRSLHDAILVGRNTFAMDTPTLTARHWPGPQPLRLILGHCPIVPKGFEQYGHIDEALQSLYERGVQRLLVEGGRRVLTAFIERGLWEEAHEEIAPLVLKRGVRKPHLEQAVLEKEENFFGHTIRHYRNVFAQPDEQR